MAASSSRPRKRPLSARREADPSGWISDDKTRERFLIMQPLKEVVKHHMAELALFEQEKFMFPDDLKFQGLNKFIEMKGDCYNELVEIFYYNVKEVNGNIHSRVKGIDIVIDDDIWWKFTRLRNEGELSHKFDCPHYKKIRKIEMFKSFMRYRGRYRKEKGLPYGVFISKVLEHYGVNFTDEKKQTCGRENMIGKAYGVFISKVLEHYGVNFTNEKKQTCGRENMIGKATLTCIGMKKTPQGWKEKVSAVNQDSDEELGSLNSEFEIREKMDILFKHYIEISSSSEESERRDVDDISEETTDVESSESE
ncbi:hypothetical protein V8G54_020450 [Vigna mungo]|uniref:Uncharacterized protein n=1 Tax=Vigna mungo TaxID=3915 RepID=A0AAQ3RTE5_VIGMU